MANKDGKTEYVGMNSVIHKALEWVLSIFHITLVKEKQSSFEQFVRFCIVGLSNTLLSYAIYAATVFILQKSDLFPKGDYFIGNVISWVLSVAWSFYWNNRFVFNEEKRSGKQIFFSLIKCYASYAFSGLILTNILSWVWIDKLGINRYIAPFINLIISVPVNFFMNKFWAFSNKKTNK